MTLVSVVLAYGHKLLYVEFEVCGLYKSISPEAESRRHLGGLMVFDGLLSILSGRRLLHIEV